MNNVFDLYKQVGVNTASLFDLSDYKHAVDWDAVAVNAAKARSKLFDVTEKNLGLAAEIAEEHLSTVKTFVEDAASKIDSEMSVWKKKSK